MRGSAYRDVDLALVKHTKLTERTDMEFRAEMFDVMNTPAFAQLWAARFDELDKLVEELKQKENAHGRKKR